MVNFTESVPVVPLSVSLFLPNWKFAWLACVPPNPDIIYYIPFRASGT